MIQVTWDNASGDPCSSCGKEVRDGHIADIHVGPEGGGEPEWQIRDTISDFSLCASCVADLKKALS